MDSRAFNWLLQCIFAHLFGFIGTVIAVKLCAQEFKTFQTEKQVNPIALPKRVYRSAFCVMGLSTIVIIGMWAVISPYICHIFQSELINEFAYVWTRLCLFYFQSERLRGLFGNKNGFQFGYPNWVFLVYDSYLLLLGIGSIFTCFIFKTQRRYSLEDDEYYYKGCYQVFTDLRLMSVAVHSLLVFFADWCVLILYYIKIQQLKKELVTKNPQVTKTLRNVLRKIFGLSLSIEVLTLLSVLINFMFSGYIAAQNLSVIIDSLWNIIAVRYMLDYNAKEFSKFRQLIVKHFDTCGIANVCCCLCFCPINLKEQENDENAKDNVNSNGSSGVTQNKGKSNTDREATIVSKTLASNPDTKMHVPSNHDEDSVL